MAPSSCLRLLVVLLALFCTAAWSFGGVRPSTSGGRSIVSRSSSCSGLPHTAGAARGAWALEAKKGQGKGKNTAEGASSPRPKKEKDDVIEVEGVVKESLPSAMFRVELTPTGNTILCTISGKIRKNLVRILVGDPVRVELSPYDLTRGRITYRYKK